MQTFLFTSESVGEGHPGMRQPHSFFFLVCVCEAKRPVRDAPRCSPVHCGRDARVLFDARRV